MITIEDIVEDLADQDKEYGSAAAHQMFQILDDQLCDAMFENITVTECIFIMDAMYAYAKAAIEAYSLTAKF